MTRLIALCLALVAGSAAAYPVTVANRTPAEVAKRRAEFVARNPEHWVELRLDEHGFVTYALTDDATLATADLPKLRDFARRNADLLGMPPAAADRIAANQVGDAEVVDSVDGALLGMLQLHHGAVALNKPALTINATFWIDAKPSLTKAAFAKRFDGQSYSDVTTYGGHPKLDCAMTPAGVAGCATGALGTTQQTVKLTEQTVRVLTNVYRVGATYRLVRCADVGLVPPPPPDPKWGRADIVSRILTPIGGAPPIAIDAVTGEVVLAKGCEELRNTR